MGFYFVLSNINAVVSSTIRKDVEFAARLSMLEKVKKKYGLVEKTYKGAKVSLYESERTDLDFDLQPFFRRFPSSLREDLKFHLNVRKLGSFDIFRNLERSVINTLGDCLKELRVPPSRPNQIRPCTLKTTPPKTYTLWSRAAR